MTQIVYFAQRADGDIKIGTTRHYISRMRQLMFVHGALEVLGTVPGNRHTERAMHARFADHQRARLGDASGRYHPLEWFAPAPELLWFVAFETQRTEPCIFRTTPKERVFFADEPRRRYKRTDGGISYAPTTNEVQRRLFARFGSLDNIHYQRLAKETGIAPMAIHGWLEGWYTTCEMVTVRKWAAYLNCAPEDILTNAGRGAPVNTPAPATPHRRGRGIA